MTPEECERRLHATLAAHGTTAASASPAEAWKVFLEVCGPLVPSEEIGLLVELGTHDGQARKCYHFSLNCQFPDPESDEFVQVRFALARGLDEAVGVRKWKIWWSWDFKTLKDMVEDIEVRETFYLFMGLTGWTGSIAVCSTG